MDKEKFKTVTYYAIAFAIGTYEGGMGILGGVLGMLLVWFFDKSLNKWLGKKKKAQINWIGIATFVVFFILAVFFYFLLMNKGVIK